MVFYCDLENMVKVSKTFLTFCHVHVLDSCKFGQNTLTHSEDNVNLSNFSPKFSSFSTVTLKIRSRFHKLYRYFAMSSY